MRKRILIPLLVMMLIPVCYAGINEIQLHAEYDPRVDDPRIVVLPAELPRSVKKIDPETISNLLATELLNLYDVLELARFKQSLGDRGLTLDEALSASAQGVVNDSMGINAISKVEIYLWDPEAGGFPFLVAPGKMGIRISLLDPFTGRMYWSLNRVKGVNGANGVLNAVTTEFARFVKELGKELREYTKELNKSDRDAQKAARKKKNREEKDKLKEYRDIVSAYEDQFDSLETVLDSLRREITILGQKKVPLPVFQPSIADSTKNDSTAHSNDALIILGGASTDTTGIKYDSTAVPMDTTTVQPDTTTTK